ncbi:MAG TPA: hypothetical protein ACHBX0_02505 [Arsenophonus sp.]
MASEFMLRTNRIQFSKESFLSATTIMGKLVGQNPADFHLTGALSEQQIGPIPRFLSVVMVNDYEEMRFGKIRLRCQVKLVVNYLSF